MLAALRLDANRLPVPRADGDREALRILLVACLELAVVSATLECGAVATVENEATCVWF